MKKLIVVLCCTLLWVSVSLAQLKSQTESEPSASRSLIHPSTGLSSFFGLLNSENFMMRHSFSLNYMTAGGQGISIADYTNSMFYKIADPLNVRFDITLQGSPFGQYGSFQQSDLSKIYLSRAELNYHPADDLYIKLQYRQLPFSYYNNYGLSNPFFSNHPWGDE